MADVTPTEVRNKANTIRLRKNILNLSPRELNDFRNAVEGLFKVSETGGNNDERGYQWIAGVHGQPIPIYCQHGNLNFPTWHRAYIYEYELRLQEQVPTVMLPYWDWTGPVALRDGIPPAFADDTYVDLNTRETKPNPLKSAFSQVTNRPTHREPGPVADLADLKRMVETALAQQTYDRFSPALETPHGGLHVWVGGDMSAVPLAAYDPIFWCHHANVDRQWFEWQRQHGNASVPDAVKQFVCTPFAFTGEDTLDTTNFGYTYAEGEVAAPDLEDMKPGESEGVGYVAIPTPTGDFKHAMLEVQGLEKTEESYVVDFFFGEEKEAKAEAYNQSNFAARFYLLGHGSCAGGPGHCSRRPKSRYDKRPPSHLEPYDTYQVITDPLKAYLETGPKDVQFTLCVTKPGGKPAPLDKFKYVGLSVVTHQ